MGIEEKGKEGERLVRTLVSTNRCFVAINHMYIKTLHMQHAVIIRMVYIIAS